MKRISHIFGIFLLASIVLISCKKESVDDKKGVDKVSMATYVSYDFQESSAEILDVPNDELSDMWIILFEKEEVQQFKLQGKYGTAVVTKMGIIEYQKDGFTITDSKSGESYSGSFVEDKQIFVLEIEGEDRSEKITFKLKKEDKSDKHCGFGE